MANFDPIFDRRKYRRYRVLKDGKIFSLDLKNIFETTITDMSVGGARVIVSKQFDLTNGFNLLVTSEHLLYPAVEAWRIGEMMGITFVGEPRRNSYDICPNCAPVSSPN